MKPDVKKKALPALKRTRSEVRDSDFYDAILFDKETVISLLNIKYSNPVMVYTTGNLDGWNFMFFEKFENGILDGFLYEITSDKLAEVLEKYIRGNYIFKIPDIARGPYTNPEEVLEDQSKIDSDTWVVNNVQLWWNWKTYEEFEYEIE